MELLGIVYIINVSVSELFSFEDNFLPLVNCSISYKHNRIIKADWKPLVNYKKCILWESFFVPYPRQLNI